MTPQVGDLRTITQRFDGEQWVNCLQSMPPRKLSDEEIIEVFESPFHPNTTGKINDEVIAFVRAILRKAQEK